MLNEKQVLDCIKYYEKSQLLYWVGNLSGWKLELEKIKQIRISEGLLAPFFDYVDDITHGIDENLVQGLNRSYKLKQEISEKVKLELTYSLINIGSYKYEFRGIIDIFIVNNNKNSFASNLNWLQVNDLVGYSGVFHYSYLNNTILGDIQMEPKNLNTRTKTEIANDIANKIIDIITQNKID